ncbi:hypothetical protein DJ010_16205 [Nocardioides silvaticus]|uniref:Uncharacterized protein n=1 Tax=Nocardioides silvaticus TaxID=2201891 RepID=A0A316TFZ6_9ACTN|nr:hypothetical protein [Nocardioides silvaticus]PWN02065.1 hypothetical protein DJ010_16205 [Nocardioides silvaticus]
MSFLTETLLVTGVALDLVGAAVLSHAHNAESVVELREEVDDEGSALGEPDAVSTHARLLAEKRIGFLLLTVGLSIYLCGIVLKSPEDTVLMAPIAIGVVAAGVAVSVVFIRVAGRRIREQARKAEAQGDPDELPEQ